MEVHKQKIEQMLRLLAIEEGRSNKQIDRKQESKLMKVTLQLARMTGFNEITNETCKKQKKLETKPASEIEVCAAMEGGKEPNEIKKEESNQARKEEMKRACKKIT